MSKDNIHSQPRSPCHLDHAEQKKRCLQRESSTMTSFSLMLLIAMLSNTASILCQYFSVEAEIHRVRSQASSSRIPKKRKFWSVEESCFSDRMFCTSFYMHRNTFYTLCDHIEKAIGKETFKSEKYLQNLRNLKHSTRVSSMYKNSSQANREYISGEMKLAITLRYLGRASYLDLYAWFNVDASCIITIAKTVCRE